MVLRKIPQILDMVFFLCPFMFSGTTFQTIAVLPTGGISELLGGYLGHLVLPN